MKRLVIGAGLVTLAAGCGAPPPAPAHAEPPAKVAGAQPEAALATLTLTAEAQRRLGIETAAVERRQLARTRTLGGDVMPEGAASSTVLAPLSGTIATDVPAPRVGAEVTQGQRVLALVPFAPADRDVRIEAQRLVAEAEGRADMMRKRVSRATQLEADGSGSRRALEEATADLAVAEAALQAARDRLALAAKGVTRDGAVIMNAPATALLRTLHAAPGQTVAAGAPLFDLVRLNAVWIRVPVFAGDVDTLDLRSGASLVSLGHAADAPGRAVVPVAAPPTADAPTAGVDLYYRAANDDRTLRPGQRVSIRIPLRSVSEQWVAPRAAVLFDAMGGTWVYEAQDGGRFVRRRVAVVDMIGEFAVLQQAPIGNRRVVTTGAAELFGTEFGVGK